MQTNNKLIAEFMGLEPEKTLAGAIVYARKEWNNPKKANDCQTEFYEADELLYHFSWNWLMPVLNKLWNLKSFMDFESELSIKFEEIFNIDFTLCEFFQGDITSIYSRAVEFIEWYNDNK